MKLKKNARKLAGSIALLGVIYNPLAMANGVTTPLGTLTTLNPSTQIPDSHIAAGSFTDIYTFTAGANVMSAASVSSIFTGVVTPSASYPVYTGVEVTELKLIDVSNNNAVVKDVLVTLPTPVVTTVGTTVSSKYSPVTISFSGVDLIKNDNYQLDVIGTGGSRLTQSAPGNYSGSLSITAVPEPEQWVMLLLGMPLLGWMVRRKQVI